MTEEDWPRGTRPIDHGRLRAHRLETGGRDAYGNCPRCGKKLYTLGQATDTKRVQLGCPSCGYHHTEGEEPHGTTKEEEGKPTKQQERTT